MRYQDRNFQRLQERQKQNPKESKCDFLIRTGREKKHLRFYKETAHNIYDIDSWYCLTEKQRDEIIESKKKIIDTSTRSIYSYFIWTWTPKSPPFFINEKSWIEYVKETYKPDPAEVRAKTLKKIGI
jgi:hypothetical protein